MWRFEIYQDAANQYRWRLKAPNGRIMADSGEGYVSRSNARRAAEDVRRQIGGANIEDVY
jgi:uncharacterized protein YegP (UPF0339 family)